MGTFAGSLALDPGPRLPREGAQLAQAGGSDGDRRLTGDKHKSQPATPRCDVPQDIPNCLQADAPLKGKQPELGGGRASGTL